MSVSSLLLINTLSQRISTTMRVYDIVSAKNQLTEEYEVVPRGKPPNKLFVVVDPISGKELGSYRTPGQARDAAKDGNAKIKAAADKLAADEKAKIEKAKSVDRFFRNLKITSNVLYTLFAGFSVKQNIDKHIKEQTELYDAYRKGEYGTVESPKAVEIYEQRSKVIYGAFVSQTAATVLATGAHAYVAAKIINAIKAARAAGMIAGTASLGAGSVIAFLTGEAASYAATWLINKPSTIEWLIKYTWNAPMISKAFILASDYTPAVGLDPDVEKNLQQALQMDKRKEAGDAASKNTFTAPKPAAAPAAAADAPPAAAGSSGAPAAPGNWAASFLD
jgi:hypothetical protein